ncbi:MAG: helix-turn-helix transcriptional regulator [Clostridia bacterium]|nr:helix-turn-helix transcriptional regulator [Clostridia bacterium]
MLKLAIDLWKRGKNKNGVSLQRRLFLFFSATTVFVVLLFAALLIILDVGGSGVKTVRNYAEGELSHMGNFVETDFGRLSVQGVSFAENAGKCIDEYLAENNISQNSLDKSPEHLIPILSRQIDEALATINKSICTGVFILLDATVNLSADNAAYSRAGIFIKNTHPNSADTVHSKFNYLRGPAEIARANGIELLGQWKMEFDTENESFWNDVMEVAKENEELPLSRLYYWTDCIKLKGNSESGILLCVPVRSDGGEIYGVCGVEVSDMLFKQKYTPNDSVYKRVFTLMAPMEGNILHSENGLIAGNYFLTGDRMQTSLSLSESTNGICFYENENISYGGVHRELKLYPHDSPYQADKWAISVMMPKTVIDEAEQGVRTMLFALVILLLAVSFVVSIFISKKYLKPVTEALDSIKTRSYTKETPKNVYIEINDLMDFLVQQEESVKPQSETATMSMFDNFLENLKTLSKAEAMVFDKYLDGLKAQEIADELHLSINTIKTHNRRIFSKLNVSTRKELMVYIDMMKERKLIGESDKG